MKICVYGSSSSVIPEEYLKTAEELGRLLAERGHGLVFGGGDKGVMGAVARGVTAGNGYILGIAPSLFNVDGILYEHCTEFIYTDTMRQRKEQMEKHADAFLMAPGGIGTWDEFFEVLTLKQLGLLAKPIVVMNINSYYEPLENMMYRAMDQQFMKIACKDLCGICNTPEEALDYLETENRKES